MQVPVPRASAVVFDDDAFASCLAVGASPRPRPACVVPVFAALSGVARGAEPVGHRASTLSASRLPPPSSKHFLSIEGEGRGMTDEGRVHEHGARPGIGTWWPRLEIGSGASSVMSTRCSRTVSAGSPPPRARPYIVDLSETTPSRNCRRLWPAAATRGLVKTPSPRHVKFKFISCPEPLTVDGRDAVAGHHEAPPRGLVTAGTIPGTRTIQTWPSFLFRNTSPVGPASAPVWKSSSGPSCLDGVQTR